MIFFLYLVNIYPPPCARCNCEISSEQHVIPSRGWLQNGLPVCNLCHLVSGLVTWSAFEKCIFLEGSGSGRESCKNVHFLDSRKRHREFRSRRPPNNRCRFQSDRHHRGNHCNPPFVFATYQSSTHRISLNRLLFQWGLIIRGCGYSLMTVEAVPPLDIQIRPLAFKTRNCIFQKNSVDRKKRTPRLRPTHHRWPHCRFRWWYCCKTPLWSDGYASTTTWHAQSC